MMIPKCRHRLLVIVSTADLFPVLGSIDSVDSAFSVSHLGTRHPSAMTLTLPPPLRRSARTRQTPNAPPEQEVPAPETTKPAPLRKRKQIETEGNNGGAHEPKRVKKRSANMAADARAIATAV